MPDSCSTDYLCSTSKHSKLKSHSRNNKRLSSGNSVIGREYSLNNTNMYN